MTPFEPARDEGRTRALENGYRNGCICRVVNKKITRNDSFYVILEKKKKPLTGRYYRETSAEHCTLKSSQVSELLGKEHPLMDMWKWLRKTHTLVLRLGKGGKFFSNIALK